jgi:predicted ATPase
MIDDICGRPPPASVVKLVYSNTEGNAFFVKELVRHLLERGALLDSDGDFRANLKPAQIDLPDNLRLVVGRRLARLGKETLQVLGVAATIGKSFTFEPLRVATQLQVDRLLGLVEKVEKSGLLFSTQQYPEARFQFSHEIVRQTVLGELSATRRQRIHLRIADAIAQTSADSLEERANDLAYHLWQAGAAADPARTIRLLDLAAERAKQQGALEALLHHSQNALELLARQPETDARARLELGFHLNCGIALMAIRGWAAATTDEDLESRARSVRAI